jgi:hypothetical protein
MMSRKGSGDQEIDTFILGHRYSGSGTFDTSCSIAYLLINLQSPIEGTAHFTANHYFGSLIGVDSHLCPHITTVMMPVGDACSEVPK